MGSVRRRVRQKAGLESAISICLLVILFLIGLGIFIKQFDYDMSRFGVGAIPAGLSSQQLGVNREEKPALSSLAPAGFKTLSEAELYYPENLYEKINGKAPLYLESGFVELFTQRFISQSDENLWMELFVYDMATIKNAFSVYSVQKRADVELLPDKQFGYRTSNALYFVQGKYYVELLGSAESAELLGAMPQVAQKISSNLPVDKEAKIDELTLFATENLVPGSTKLYLTNAFGFEGLTDTFIARYKFGDESITAFLSQKDSTAEAIAAFNNYYKFLLDNGGKELPTTNPKIRFVDFYGTLEIVAVAGPFVFGIHEAENPQLAAKVQKRLIDKLLESTETVQND
ncbi:MAG: DUF6599 family protein [Sedimentisphaerales bacterium]